MSGRSSSLLFPPSDEKTKHCRLINLSLAIVKGEQYEFLTQHCLPSWTVNEQKRLLMAYGLRASGISLTSLCQTHTVLHKYKHFRYLTLLLCCIQKKLWWSIIYCLSICGTKEPCLSPRRALCLHSPCPTALYLPFQYFWANFILVSLPIAHKAPSILLLYKTQCPRAEPQQVTTSSQTQQYLRSRRHLTRRCPPQ